MGDREDSILDPLQDAVGPDIDRARQAEVIEALRETTLPAAEHRRVYELKPASGSPALKEQAAGRDISLEYTNAAFSMPWLLMVASEDHVNSLRLVLHRASQFSPAVLARAALEAAARAWWHLHPQIDINERIRRSMSEQLYSYGQFVELEKLHEGEDFGGLERLEETARDAKALGFDVRRSKKTGLPVAIGDDRPGSGELIEAMMTAYHPTMGPFMWRQLSAVAHGTAYALVVGVGLQDHPLDSTMKALVPRMQTGDLEWPATVAAIGHAQAFERMVEVYGWDIDYWRKWKNELGIKLIRERHGWRGLDGPKD
jgi:hypothetical protein